MTTIRFATFPRTVAPPSFAETLVKVFRDHEPSISTLDLEKGLTSNEVLTVLRDDLLNLGFAVEGGVRSGSKIARPVFFGDNGIPTLRAQVDGYQEDWECGLEIEAGRAWMGNAVYRDLIQASVMVQVQYLALAVPNTYRYKNAGKPTVSQNFDHARAPADALFGHSRLRLPYDLILIGY